MKQTDSVWIAPGKPVAVLAAPGSAGAWPAGHSSERVARAFIAAAAKAGGDAVELDADHCTGALVAFARERGLHVVARVGTPTGACSAADAGTATFHVESDVLADDAIRHALAEVASCVIVSACAGHAEGPVRLAGGGPAILPLYTHDELLGRFQASPVTPSPVRAPVGLFGCELGGAAPAAGVLAVAFGASLVRQYLAITRYPRSEEAAHFLSESDFTEMVQNLRATESILGRSRPAVPRPDRLSPPTARNIRPAGLIRRDQFEPDAGAEGKMANIAVGKGYAVLASELAATVVILIDFTASPGIQADALELLLSRLQGAHTADHTCALLSGAEPQEVRDALARRGIDSRRAEKGWLTGVLALGDKHSADAVLWVPAENVPADPALLDRMAVQHVKSAADYTLCSGPPRATGARLVSMAALRRIGAFTAGNADAATTHKLLGNHRVFRVQEMTSGDQHFDCLARVSCVRREHDQASESEAREPFCACSFVIHGNDASTTL